jgi:hypothetical protein
MGRTGLILFGGGGHCISLPVHFAYTVHIYNFVRDLIRTFFKDFPVGGGGAFFEENFLRDNTLVGIAMWPTYHA